MVESSKPQRRKIVHLSPVPSASEPMTSQTRRYGELERLELLPEIMRLFLYGILTLVLLSLAWSVFAKVDVVSAAPARLVPFGHVKIVQPEFSGVIDRLLVKEGQRVTAGSVIAVLEPYAFSKDVQVNSAELEIAQKKLKTLEQAAAMLRTAIADPAAVQEATANAEGAAAVLVDLKNAYADWKESEFDVNLIAGRETSEMSAIRKQQASLSLKKGLHQEALAEQIQEKQSKLNQKKLEIEQDEKLVVSAEKELNQLKLVLNATEQQEAAYADVFKQGAVSKVDYLNMVKEAERTRREITQQEAVVVDLKKQLEIARAQLAELRFSNRASLLDQAARIQDVSAEIGKVDALKRSMSRRYKLAQASYQSALSATRAALSTIDTELNSQKQRIRQAQEELKHASQMLSNSEIKAPVSGTVTGIKIRGKGQVVTRGERLLSIVPENGGFIFEAAIPNKDSGFVREGQTVKIKLLAYPFEDFGIMNGTVIAVEAASDAPSRPDAPYLAQIKPERDFVIAYGEKRPLISGMSATCEIVCRRERVLDLLLKPVKRMKETNWQ